MKLFSYNFMPNRNNVLQTCSIIIVTFEKLRKESKDCVKKCSSSFITQKKIYVEII